MLPPSFDGHNVAEVSADSGDEFLTAHEFDEPEHMLTNLDDLLAAFNYQEHQVVRLRQEQVWNDHLDDGTRTDVTTPCSTAVSYATGTSVTQKITNLDRYALKNKVKKKSPAHKTKLMTEGLQYEINNNDSGRVGQKQLLPSPLGHNLTKVPESHELPKVLQLKMKANLVNFYNNEFLSMFPDTLVSIGTSYSPPPDLMASNSDSSAEASFASDGTAVCFEVDDTSFLDLVVSGSFGLFDKSHGSSSHFQSASSSYRDKYQKNPQHYIVLSDQRTGEIKAVCALKSKNGPPIVRIYSTKPIKRDQEAATTMADIGLADSSSRAPSPYLYPWAELTVDGSSFLTVHYSIYMATGSNGRFEDEPSYTGMHIDGNSLGLMMLGRTEKEQNYSGCCTLTIQPEGFFSMSISYGVDPSLFICLTAIFDEIFELKMRKLCDANAKRLLKRLKARQKRWSSFEGGN